MATNPHDELLSSLKGLLLDPLYSDLTIRSRDKNYHVHKALVCPRSEFFTSKCQDLLHEAPSTAAVLNLPDDDPTAVDMVIQYLYRLDYPCSTSDLDSTPRVNGYSKDEEHADEDVCESPTVQQQTLDGGKPFVPAPPSVTSQDDRDLSLRSSLVKPGKAGRKKKKKKLAAMAPLEADTVEPPPVDGAVDPHPPAPEPEPDVDHEVAAALEPATPTTPNTTMVAQSNLVIHAKVFLLSQKYGIDGLRGLALDKFEKEAEEGWNTHDFLLAAREVYNSSTTGDDDRRMKEAVTGIVCQHLELLDKEETQNAIRDLQLNYDVLIRMRKDKLL